MFHAGILIEPHIPELDEFKEYFNDAIKVSFMINDKFLILLPNFRYCIKFVSFSNELFLCRILVIMLYKKSFPNTSELFFHQNVQKKQI